MATKKRYNFKGLDEIFGESVADLVDNLEGDTKKAQELSNEVPIEQLSPNRYQPRVIFDEDTLLELRDSIKQHGIIQPIVVNVDGENHYEIVAGERRFRAAQMAGLKTVPVNIVSLTPTQMEEFAIIENIQRVNLTDIEEAIAYRRLADNAKLKQEEIAARVGKSRAHVANIMRLLNLPKYVQDGMMNHLLTMGQAKPLLTILSNEELLHDVFDKIVLENLNAREVENLIKKLQQDPTHNLSKAAKKDPNIVGVENQLMRTFGTPVTIANNKITIKYTDDKDLNRILEIMGYDFH